MVSLIEYWREISVTFGAVIVFLGGRKSAKILERKQSAEAIDTMQKTYGVFLEHYKVQYDELILRLNRLELRNAVLTESSEAWEKKFKELSKKYEQLKIDFEKYKSDFK